MDVSPKWPTSPEYYNSAITVNADGETVANYRKSFLYVTDETWALEGPNGFYDDDIEGLGRVAMGICAYHLSCAMAELELMNIFRYGYQVRDRSARHASSLLTLSQPVQV